MKTSDRRVSKGGGDGDSDSGHSSSKSEGTVDVVKRQAWEAMAKSKQRQLESEQKGLEEKLEQFIDRSDGMKKRKAIALNKLQKADGLDTSSEFELSKYEQIIKQYEVDRDFFNKDDPGRREGISYKIYDCIPRFQRVRMLFIGELSGHNGRVDNHNRGLDSKSRSLAQFKVDLYDYNLKLPHDVDPLPDFETALRERLWEKYSLDPPLPVWEG